MAFKQGYYTLQHPEKYIGNPNQIRYLSSWELEFNKFLDNNPKVLKWASEAFFIPYVHPIDKKIHRYLPDYYVEYENINGEIIQEIIEIKPIRHAQLAKRATTYEQISYVINIAKWKSARIFCEKQGIRFRILTENELFHQGKNTDAKKSNNTRRNQSSSRTSSRDNTRNNHRRTHKNIRRTSGINRKL
jgi:hypothetical protein